jgi:predicted AlkP superfamily pyrophosphatase or phosphodiesterase
MTQKSAVRLGIFAGLVLLLTTACSHQPAIDEVIKKGSGGVNSAEQQAKPYLVLISIDGFRWDYMDRYPTPNMDRIAAKGSKAERLLPVFPTLTFPNHFSIATGLYPTHHGLVANRFPDPSRDMWFSLGERETVEDPQFYAGEPIWVTAETQGMVSASFYWVGSEAAVMGVSPSHWRSYDKSVTGETRVDQVLTWLAEPEPVRPHLITLYFEDVDDNSHWYGPDSKENIEAIKRVDAYIGRLLNGLQTLPHAQQVNIILLSDHGQASYKDNPEPFILSDHAGLEKTMIIEGGSYLFLHFDQENPKRASHIVETVNQHWQHGRAYLPGDTPEHWQVGDNPRYPDVILIPKAGFAVLSTAEKSSYLSKGDHGWAPDDPDMHGFFVASGPNITPGISLGPIRSVDVHPLMLGILGLNAPDNTDGDAGSLARILDSGENCAPGSNFSSGLYKCYPPVIWFPDRKNQNQ